MFVVSNITNGRETATLRQALLQCLSFFLDTAVLSPAEHIRILSSC